MGILFVLHLSCILIGILRFGYIVPFLGLRWLCIVLVVLNATLMLVFLNNFDCSYIGPKYMNVDYFDFCLL
jgi:hypothetical protein